LDAYAGEVQSTSRSTLVVGAGIIGLTSAFRLAMAGHQVVLLDPAPAQGATWAAAGMLAPTAEIAPGEEENYSLQRRSLEQWRDVASQLRTITEQELQIHETDTLLVGFDASDARLISQFRIVATSFGARTTVVTREQSPELFAFLSPRINEGLLLAGDAWLDPDAAVQLLQKALVKLGVEFVEEQVLSVESHDSGVTAQTATRMYSGDAGILATGATRLPQGAISSGEHVTRPVHGVTLRVKGIDRSAMPMVRAFVRGRNFYMVSRPGGHCVLGATVEERGVPGAQVGELHRLLRDALDIVPELETATVIEHRSGLRPASDNLQPFFEPLQTKGWAWSSGYYRHGVTLAPLAAQSALEFVESSW
jgi:glycine oxidase